MPFIRSVRARNILSFGESSPELELRDLNVIIGANSSGKSNLISLFSLLRAAPADITKPIATGGGIREWLWKGGKGSPDALVEVCLHHADDAIPLRYSLSFREEAQRFSLVDEYLENEWKESAGQRDVRFFYRFGAGAPYFSVVATEADSEEHPRPGKPNSRPSSTAALPPKRTLRKEKVEPNQSVLSQRRGPEQYPEITFVAEAFSKIRIFQDWEFSLHSPARLPQGTDLPNDYLADDASNLALLVDDIKFGGGAELQSYLELANPAFKSVSTRTQGGTIQLFIEEAGLISPTPATRLSQGALHLLCLLVVLLHPRQPKLVCIEEPEKGLHPDILPKLANLLVQASKRTQLVVTTHSEILVDALSETPESVIVCERQKAGTSLVRLSSDHLKEWLERYSLGQLWRKGTLGANRW